MRQVLMVVDLQFGSTGKGQIAGTIGRKWDPDTVVCANGPNAGHTYRWHEGDELRQTINTVMPVTSVLPGVRNILLGPGAVIDPHKLAVELDVNSDLLQGKRLIIHPNASVVQERHREAEKELLHIGSTMKGTAEAVIEKMRRGEDASIARRFNWDQIKREWAGRHLEIIVSAKKYEQAIDSSDKLLVEGAQGASLSMHSEFYPHCTSRDVSSAQIWADCHLPAKANGADVFVIGVARTYPIRVAHRWKDGVQVGHSGGHWPDQQEIDWKDIGREPELTTVTKLPRRLFTFSTEQILDAVRYNAPTSIALTFCDYLPDHNPQHPDAGKFSYDVRTHCRISPSVYHLLRRIEAAAGCDVDFLSFGPNDTDVYSISGYEEPHPHLASLWLPWGN